MESRDTCLIGRQRGQFFAVNSRTALRGIACSRERAKSMAGAPVFHLIKQCFMKANKCQLQGQALLRIRHPSFGPAG